MQWLSPEEINSVARVQNVDETVCILGCANTPGNTMNFTNLPPSIST